MSEAVARALALWGMTGANTRLVAARENHVFEVTHDEKTVALRLHRQGYRTDAELQSELQWMAAMAQAGISTPAPIPARDGALIHVVDGVQVDMLTWLAGSQMGKTGALLDLPDKTGVFETLGQLLATLHSASDDWKLPAGFVRPAWDADGLIGDEPLWGPFWQNPELTTDERDMMERLRVQSAEVLSDQSLDYGLIHADAVRENVLIEGETLHLIDFDDGGFGYRLFDLATALVKNIDEPTYPALREAFLGGYGSLRHIDTDLLDLFLALRAATYVGWIVPRLGEARAAKSVPRLINAAMRLSGAYFAANEMSVGRDRAGKPIRTGPRVP